ncbi:MAG: PAS domain S-box protein [Deltaproteobacteria bacterium]|nr:PAS domain S-box protein [Deltaproteobacteria bacterium]
MTTPLKVLIVEDSEDDALLISYELRRGGYEVAYRRVETETEMIKALQSETWELVISDYIMPNFSGPDALKVLKWQGIDLPFILVSGKVGEETAVEAMKAGANDYILKQRMARLVPAVRRELQEAESRRERRRVEKALEDSEEKYRLMLAEEELSRAIFAQAEPAIIVCDEKGVIIRASQAAKTICGANPLLKSFQKTFPLGHAGGDSSLSAVLGGEVFHGVEVTCHKKGESLHLLLNAGPLVSKKAGLLGCVVTLTDISERKRAEESLRRSQENYRRLSKTANEGIWILDPGNNTAYANPKLAEMLGYTPEEMLGASFFQFMTAEARINAEIDLGRIRQGMSRKHDFKFRRKDGGDLWAILSTSPILDDEGHYQGMLGMLTDITGRIRAEDAGRELLEELRLANEELHLQTQKLELHKGELLSLTQALEMKQNFLETVLRQLPAGVVIAEAPSGKLVLGNDQMESIFGLGLGNDVNIFDCYPYKFFRRDGSPYLPEEWPLSRSLVAGESVRDETMIFFPHPEIKKTLLVNSAPIYNHEGEIVAAVAVFRDLTPAPGPRRSIASNRSAGKLAQP